MAEFNTFDLGRVIQTAEAIKGLKRQSSIDALQERYLGQRIEAGEQEMARNKRQDEVVLGREKAAQLDAAAGYVLQAPNPKNFVEQNYPEFIKDLESQGIQWVSLDDEGVRRVAQGAQAKARAELGQGPAQPDPRLQLEQQKMQQGQSQFDQRLAFDRQKLQQDAATARNQPTSMQLITRPVGNGMVQDFAWNPKTNKREAAGEPYKPVTTHTGNVTEGERKAAALGTRLEAAMQALNAIEKTDPGASRPGLIERGLESVGMEAAANVARGDGRQQADTAQLDALDAALTLATGAAYTEQQLKNLRKSYFPQIGDTDAQVAAKKKRFEIIVETARIASGRAEPSIDKAVGGGASGSWGEPGQATQVGGFTVRRIK